MTFLFHLDANENIGLGHLFRSLSIAKYLNKRYNVSICFLGNYNEFAIKLIIENSFIISEENNIVSFVKNNSVNLLYIDSLSFFTEEFIKDAKNYCKVVLLHNLTEGSFYSDLTIIPSGHTSDDIIKKIKDQKNFLYGCDYVVLNDKVKSITAKKKSDFLKKDKVRISVITGGSDPNGISMFILKILNRLEFEGSEFYFEIGKANKCKPELMLENKKDNIKFRDFDFQSIVESDFAICAFGVTAYELLYLGVPFISLGHADNTVLASKTFSDRYKISMDLGLYNLIKPEILKCTIDEFKSDKNKLIEYSEKGKELIDGKGIERVSEEIIRCANGN